jgi:hypothetical protein
VAQRVVFEHIASDMCVQNSGSPDHLSMVAMIRFEKDNLDMCIMGSKTVRSLTALSMARMKNSEHDAEDISVQDSCVS